MKRHHHKNFHQQKARDFYRLMDERRKIKKVPVVEYVNFQARATSAGQGERIEK